jgi:uncharacterized protein YggE
MRNALVPHRQALRAAGGFAVALILCVSLPAQEPERSFVTTSGKATVYTTPTHAVFWIHRTLVADKLDSALKDGTKGDAAVREAVTLRELRPTLFETGTPAIVSLHENVVRVSTEIHFSMSPYAAGEAAMIKFGELCEQLKEISAGLEGELTGPHFITSEKGAVIQDAVKEAAKEAFPAAAGAAEALGAAVRSVDLVEVSAITWNTPPETEAVYPTISQIACTAEVRVTYILE